MGGGYAARLFSFVLFSLFSRPRAGLATVCVLLSVFYPFILDIKFVGRTSRGHITGAQRKRPDHRMTSYNRALEITGCESIETTLRTRRLLWAGTLLRMSGGRLPKRIAFGNLEGAVRRGRGGKEKEWTDCVQSDIRTFGIAGDWKAMALNAEVWVETVTEGGRRFMAAWRKEEVDAARHRQEKREATRLGTLLSQTGV